MVIDLSKMTIEQRAEVDLVMMAHSLGFDSRAFMAHYTRDDIGGYPDEWEVGSIWASEGKMLYAIVCCMQPDVVAEFGTRYGCSTAHILAAMDYVGNGHLYTVDNGANGLMDVTQHPRLFQTIQDGIEYAQQWTGPCDMVFEDGPHSTEFTRGVIVEMMPHLTERAVVCVHDVAHFLVGKQVSLGFEQAVGRFGKIRIPPSDCGLGYWRRL